jgi:hypothetical protein
MIRLLSAKQTKLQMAARDTAAYQPRMRETRREALVRDGCKKARAVGFCGQKGSSASIIRPLGHGAGGGGVNAGGIQTLCSRKKMCVVSVSARIIEECSDA